MKYLTSLFLVFLSFQSLSVEPSAESKMLGLRTTIYMVDDLDKARQWYTEAFGIRPYFNESFYIGFNIRGFELGLMPATEKSTKSSVISYWGVDNVEETFNRLVLLGAKPLNPISDVGGGIKLGVVTDPFGNPLGLIYNPMFKLD